MMRRKGEKAMSLRETQAHVIDGEAFAAQLRKQLEEDMAVLRDRSIRPGLATVLVGDDYAAQAYERRVRRLAEELGCHYVAELLAPDIEQADALAVVGKLNADPRVSGILILRPLPQDRKSTRLNSSHGYISYAVFCLNKNTQ